MGNKFTLRVFYLVNNLLIIENVSYIIRVLIFMFNSGKKPKNS